MTSEGLIDAQPPDLRNQRQLRNSSHWIKRGTFR